MDFNRPYKLNSISQRTKDTWVHVFLAVIVTVAVDIDSLIKISNDE